MRQEQEAIPISKLVVNDQRNVLIEDYGLTEDEAEEVFESVKTDVMLLAQSAERDWGNEEYEAVTDVLLGIQHQQMETMKEMQQSRLTTVARYLPVVLFGMGVVTAIVTIHAVMTGPVTLPTATLGLVWVVLIASAAIVS